MALVLLELELEVVRPIPEDNHRARHVIVLYVNHMQADDFAIVEFVIVVRSTVVHGVHNLVEPVRLAEDQRIFYRDRLLLIQWIRHVQRLPGRRHVLILWVLNRQQDLLRHDVAQIDLAVSALLAMTSRLVKRGRPGGCRIWRAALRYVDELK